MATKKARVSVTAAFKILGRLSYGATDADVADLTSKGVDYWLSTQLDRTRADNDWVTQQLALFRGQNMSQAQISNDVAFGIRKYLVADETVHTTLLRQSFSSLQLQERLVEHFSDYLHVPIRTDADIFRLTYDRDVIRAHVLGNFPDMLVAATLHPAMMSYLNLDKSTASHPNENYGRELLELFTVSTEARYSESEVQDAAKLMTGFSWDKNNDVLKVSIQNHYFGPVTIMGFTDANTKTNDPNELVSRTQNLVRYLALHPQTALAFSRRLVRRFVSDTPNEVLVEDLATVYSHTNGNIPAVVRALVEHPQFIAAPVTKVKRPSEHLASTIRALNIKFATPVMGGDPANANYFSGSPVNALFAVTDRQGHLPFRWQFPNGYPDFAEAWATFSAQIQRWNLVSDLALSRQPKNFSPVDFEGLVPANLTTPTQIAQALATKFFGGSYPKAKLGLVSQAASDAALTSLPGTSRVKAIRAATILLLSSPEWNMR